MSLIDEVRKLEEEYNKKLEAVSVKEAKVSKKEEQLEKKFAELDAQKESLDLKIEENTILVGKILKDSELKEKASDLEEMQRQIRNSRVELREWENRLYKIEKNQEEKESKLIQDRIDLDKAKKTYKEELKEAFFKELESKVSKL